MQMLLQKLQQKLRQAAAEAEAKRQAEREAKAKADAEAAAAAKREAEIKAQAEREAKAKADADAAAAAAAVANAPTDCSNEDDPQFVTADKSSAPVVLPSTNTPVATPIVPATPAPAVTIPVAVPIVSSAGESKSNITRLGTFCVHFGSEGGGLQASTNTNSVLCPLEGIRDPWKKRNGNKMKKRQILTEALILLCSAHSQSKFTKRVQYCGFLFKFILTFFH